jgi:hypothetical protein
MDSSGAVVAGARVTLENIQTGVTTVVNSNATGNYVFVVAPGMYKLKVEQPGFKTYEENNVPVAVAVTSTHDVRLTLGATTTAVNGHLTCGRPANELHSTRGCD